MISAAGTALVCLCLAQTLLAEPHNLRAYARNLHVNKELISLLASIEERLRVVDTISDVQTKQARRLEGIQEQLDRLETTVYLKIERTQLAAERLEHRLHILETNVQTSIKESSEQIEQSLEKIGTIFQNLTRNIQLDENLVDKTSGVTSDVESPRRGHTSLESLMRDGLAVVNATRRELADGLRGVVRRQGAVRQDLEFILTRRLNDNNQRIDTKIQEMLQTQRLLIDSCQRVQLDDPQKNVTDVLDRLIDSLINITSATFREIQNIHITIRNNDIKVMNLLNTVRTFQPHLLNTQSDPTCKRLEIAFRNASISTFKENELRQLTEKFISLTDRADAALQKFEVRLADESDEPEALGPDVAAEADKLLLKLHGIKDEPDSDENNILEENDQNNSYFGDDGGDIMDEDKKILSQTLENIDNLRESKTIRPRHQRHLHKHPYDRGPKKSITSTP